MRTSVLLSARLLLLAGALIAPYAPAAAAGHLAQAPSPLQSCLKRVDRMGLPGGLRLPFCADSMEAETQAAQAPSWSPSVPICAEPGGLDNRCERWVATYTNDGLPPRRGHDYSLAVTTSPTGNRVFVTGASENAAGDLDVLTVALDPASGATLWTARYDGPAHKDDAGFALAVSPDGSRVFVTGTADATPTEISDAAGPVFENAGDIVALAYDASNGSRLWAATHDGPKGGGDAAFSIAVAPDGEEVYLAGTSLDSLSLASGDGDIATVAISADTGAIRWSASYDGLFEQDDRAIGVAVDILAKSR